MCGVVGVVGCVLGAFVLRVFVGGGGLFPGVDGAGERVVVGVLGLFFAAGPRGGRV